MSPPGILYVTMQPEPGLPPAQFHEWYNNEHGPTRLRIPQIFTNGLRYRSLSGSDSQSRHQQQQQQQQQQPGFMAVYDVVDMALLATPTYTCLRANRSPREARTISRVDVRRRFFDLVHARASPRFAPPEGLRTDGEAAGRVTVAVEVRLRGGERGEGGDAYAKWFVDEHVGLLAKVPGWLRSRLFTTSSLEEEEGGGGGGEHAGEVVYFALHDYAKDNGLGGEEHKASMDTPWRTEVFDKYVVSKARQTWSLFYVFGPAPRDLESLSALPAASAAFTSPDGTTSTTPGPDPVISSFVTTPDGLAIPYRLEGNASSPDAPTVAFSNSLLTSLHMWDPLVAILKRARPDLRILRYDTRGRHAVPQPPVAATLETLSSDLVHLLDALRIPTLHALVGVSMGGATALQFALAHPGRLARLVACDFNAVSSTANTQAWKDRVAVAESNNGRGIETLAQQTVARWFHPESMRKAELVRWMTEMVAGNDVDGFKHSCTALWDYDMKPQMPDSTIPSLLAVGDEDAKGALVRAMDGFKGSLGDSGAELKIVPNAGHLPMCEAPEAFWSAIKEFLSTSSRTNYSTT
ncbi:alpha/beta hydrolase [Purpureocillium lavendulum]|uniref:Alpha/beta hydrolase n=1 Tax=Purpureocillium lavendulum TaxID=1247861 RepID=A0AB34FK67_9HYPO|nr:alpha/beta hydrolase [Purpureocillium lavendulum]